VISHNGMGKGDSDFILVFKSNHTSLVYCLRCNKVLPLAGMDVIVLYPLGDAASDFSLRNWRGRLRLCIHIALTFCV
jgi:hypothetical protein